MYAANDIKKDDKIKPSDILIKKTKGKTKPVDYYKLINKKTKYNIKKNTNLTLKII